MADEQDQATEGFAEAERRIAEVLRTKATGLDLRRLGLTSIPKCLALLGFSTIDP